MDNLARRENLSSAEDDSQANGGEWGDDFQNSVPEFRGENNSENESRFDYTVTADSAELNENPADKLRLRKEFFRENQDALSENGITNIKQIKEMDDETFNELVSKFVPAEKVQDTPASENVAEANANPVVTDQLNFENPSQDPIEDEINGGQESEPIITPPTDAEETKAEQPEFVKQATEYEPAEKAMRDEIMQQLTANSEVALQTIRLGGVRTRQDLESMSTDGLKRLGTLVLGEEAMANLKKPMALETEAPTAENTEAQETVAENAEEETSVIDKEVSNILDLPRGKRFQSLFAKFGNRLEEMGYETIGKLKALGEDGFKNLVTQLVTERFGKKEESEEAENATEETAAEENQAEESATEESKVEEVAEEPVVEEKTEEIEEDSAEVEDKSIDDVIQDMFGALDAKFDEVFVSVDGAKRALACNALFEKNQKRLNELGYFNAESMANLPNERLREVFSRLVVERLLGHPIEIEDDESDFVFVREPEEPKAEDELATEEATVEETAAEEEPAENESQEKELSDAEKAKKIERRKYLGAHAEILSALGYKSNKDIDRASDEEFARLQSKVERAESVRQGELWDLPAAKAPTDVMNSEMWAPHERFVATNLEAVNNAVTKWNSYSEVERRLMLTGQFDSFGSSAAERVSQLMGLVGAGYFNNPPMNIELPKVESEAA